MTALIGPSILSIVGIVSLVFAREFGFWNFGAPGAGLMPAIAGALLLAASLVDLRFSANQRRLPVIVWRVAIYMAGLVSIVPLAPLTGLLPALAMLIFGILYFIERLAVLRAATFAGAAVAASWLLFERLLSVPLPKSMLW